MSEQSDLRTAKEIFGDLRMWLALWVVFSVAMLAVSWSDGITILNAVKIVWHAYSTLSAFMVIRALSSLGVLGSKRS
jgi:hypothetical protein